MSRSVRSLAVVVLLAACGQPYTPSSPWPDKPRPDGGFVDTSPVYCRDGFGKVDTMRWAVDCEVRCVPLRAYSALCHETEKTPHVVLADTQHPEEYEGGTYGRVFLERACGGAGGWRVFLTRSELAGDGRQKTREQLDMDYTISWIGRAFDNCSTMLDTPSPTWISAHPEVYPYRTGGAGKDDTEIYPE